MALMEVDFVGWLSISKYWWGGWKKARQHYSVNDQESKISLLSSPSVVNGGTTCTCPGPSSYSIKVYPSDFSRAARLNIAKPLSHNRRPFDLRLFEFFTLHSYFLLSPRQDFTSFAPLCFALYAQCRPSLEAGICPILSPLSSWRPWRTDRPGWFQSVPCALNLPS